MTVKLLGVPYDNVVELGPMRDVDDVTAMVAGRIVRELLELLMEASS